MKTKKKTKNKQEEQVMKTNNNVQKTILKSLAVITSFVLISFTVNAQGFWNTLLENNSFNYIASAMVETDVRISDSNTTAISNVNAGYSEMESEISMELEDWMVNDVYFAPTFEMTEETEIPLELENWMTNSNYFSTDSFVNESEKEQTLELEGWMVDAETWK